MLKISKITLVSLSITIMLLSQNVIGQCFPPSKENALKIVKIELKKNGYEVGEKIFDIDDDNTKWNLEISRDKNMLLSPRIQQLKLLDKAYWAVYFKSKDELTLGGDGWLFVDKKSGCLIGFFLGE